MGEAKRRKQLDPNFGKKPTAAASHYAEVRTYFLRQLEKFGRGFFLTDESSQSSAYMPEVLLKGPLGDRIKGLSVDMFGDLEHAIANYEPLLEGLHLKISNDKMSLAFAPFSPPEPQGVADVTGVGSGHGTTEPVYSQVGGART